MDPLKFPTSAIPLVGQPFTAHPTWFVSAPITCNCPAKTPLVCYIGNGLPPAICPACLNIYGIVHLQGGGPKSLPLGVGITVIGKAAKTVSDAPVDKAVEQVTETVN